MTAKRTLVVIDVQNDFCPGGSLAVKEGDRVVPIINGLRDDFDIVVFTQDWHPKDHKSFAVNHPGKKEYDVIDLNGAPQVLWPAHCVQGTRGAAFHEALIVRPEDRIFRKGTDPEIDSYSAFFDNAHQKSTGLADYLKSEGIREIFLCGLATDYCVKFSVLDARGLGLAVNVLVPACRGVDLHPGDSAKAFEEMRQNGATLISTLDRARRARV